MATVLVSDLQNRFEGDLSGMSQPRLQTLIDDAEAIIATRLPQVAVRLASGALSQQVYEKVVCGMVLRVVRNPGGYSYQAAGDSVLSSSAANAGGDVDLTPSDISLLTAGSGGSTIGTARIGLDRSHHGFARW